MSMEDYNFRMARQAWGEQARQPGAIIYKQEKEMYAPQTSAGTARQEQPIFSELAQVQQNLLSLQDYICQLESSLCSVLRPEPPNEVDRLAKEDRGASPLFVSLRDFNALIQIMRGQVCSIKDRLEL